MLDVRGDEKKVEREKDHDECVNGARRQVGGEGDHAEECLLHGRAQCASVGREQPADCAAHAVDDTGQALHELRYLS